MTAPRPLRRLRHRWLTGRVIGHRNVRRCDRCRGWHHRDYHGPAQSGRKAQP